MAREEFPSVHYIDDTRALDKRNHRRSTVMPPNQRSPVTSLYVSGKNIILYSFPSRQIVMEWERLVGAIKHHMTALNSVSARENWDDKRTVASLREWFGLLNTLQVAFGPDAVPPDIVRAASQNNRVLQSMNEPPVPFPMENISSPQYKDCHVIKSISSE